MSTPQLMDYFKFDQADLEANRHGQFTEKQRQRLVQEDKSSRTWSMVIGVVLVLIAAAGFFGAVAGWIGDSDWGFRIGFGLGFGCIWPLIWGGLGFVLLSTSFSKHQFMLARVQGRANIIRTESHGSDHTTHINYELHIGGQEFNVQSSAGDVIMQGEEYILYYIADSDEILSAETV